MVALVPWCFFVVFGLDAAFYLVEHIPHPTEEEISQFRVACGVPYFIPRGDCLVLSSKGDAYRD